jgi:hypothetical protein
MSVYKKLQEARIKLQNTELRKSGHNKFAGYKYFELGDFLPAIQKICAEMGLCGVVSFDHNMAFLQIIDTEDSSSIMFTSPMSSAALKGCHDVQNLGAVQTYLRRYLWVNAFEIVEHDAIEPVTNPNEAPAKKPEAVVAPVAAAKTQPAVPSVKLDKKVELPGEWTLKPISDKGTADAWLGGLKVGTETLLQLATKPDDVANIFKVNRSLFDRAKELDPAFYADLMTSFTTTKKSLTKE